MAATIGANWDAARGRPAGFDLLRVGLALAVVLYHAVPISYGDTVEAWYWTGPMRAPLFFIVPAFFALSGFLVAGSLERNDLASFLTLRAMRIFPALSAEVVISAFIIGPLFTTLPLAEYFSSRGLYSYFLNIVGNIHYYLPGVFADLPMQGFVNVQLWPIPFELECYLALAALSVVGLTKRPKLFFSLVLLGNILYIPYLALHGGLPHPNDIPPGRLLILCFLFGVVFYQLRNLIVCSFTLFLLSAAAYAACVYFEGTIYLAPLPLAYATVYLGVQHFRLPYLTQAANYSYGIYLYGCPVQQAVCAVLPPEYRLWYVNFAIGGGITLVLAMLSWHFLESKITARRKVILRTVTAASAASANLARGSNRALVEIAKVRLGL
jgi:peptidoglycan/LPS O-acetylase OafA/YrhL